MLVEEPIPDDPATAAARAELRAVSPVQEAVDRCGPAGAWALGWEPWPAQLEDAPPGEPGPVLQPVADSVLSPGTPSMLAAGDLADTGWLLWSAPFRPVSVPVEAVEVLRALDGRRDAAAVAEAVSQPRERVDALLDALVSWGAATAA
ncbi:MAG: hypothetical protein D6798_17570 [Deltaproteobacteria bacterium]|nr:MAG: hypothetical protein D6798_17570 [Deltaproteobacteria bacterium]